MKCAIVITLVLAILYCLFNIGDAVTPSKRSRINLKHERFITLSPKEQFTAERRAKSVNKRIKQFRVIQNVTMEYLNVVKEIETMNVTNILLNTVKEIKEHAKKVGKTDPKANDHCMQAASLKMKAARVEFFKTLNEFFVVPYEKSPRVKQYENIIRKLQSLRAKLAKILRGVSRKMFTDYNKDYIIINQAANALKRKIKLKPVVSEVSRQVLKWHETLATTVNGIISTAKTCINKA